MWDLPITFTRGKTEGGYLEEMTPLTGWEKPSTIFVGTAVKGEKPS